MIKSFFFLIYSKKHMLWIFVRIASARRFLQISTTYVSWSIKYNLFLNISNYLPHLELRNRSIQIVVVTNFGVIPNVDIKRFDCINTYENVYLYPHWCSKMYPRIKCCQYVSKETQQYVVFSDSIVNL